MTNIIPSLWNEGVCSVPSPVSGLTRLDDGNHTGNLDRILGIADHDLVGVEAPPSRDRNDVMLIDLCTPKKHTNSSYENRTATGFIGGRRSPFILFGRNGLIWCHGERVGIAKTKRSPATSGSSRILASELLVRTTVVR